MDHSNLGYPVEEYGGNASDGILWDTKSRSEEHSKDQSSDQEIQLWPVTKAEPDIAKSLEETERENETDDDNIRARERATQLQASQNVHHPDDSAGKNQASSIVTIKNKLTISDDQSIGSAFKDRILSALRPRGLQLRETQQRGVNATQVPPPLPPPLHWLPLPAPSLPTDSMVIAALSREQSRPKLTQENATIRQQQFLRHHQQSQFLLSLMPHSPGLLPDAQRPRIRHDTRNISFDHLESTLANDIAFASHETSSATLENLANGIGNDGGLLSDAPDSAVLGLQNYILDLEKKAKAFDDLRELREPRRHQVLYRIHRGNHISTTYFDHPTWVVGQKSQMLQSSLPLANLSSYLEKHCDLAFIVYKDFDATKLEAEKSKAMSDESSDIDIVMEVRNTHESIFPVSRDLCATVTALLGSRPEFSELLSWYQDQSLLSGPYLAIYHSRSAMGDFMQTLPEGCQQQLCLLLDYVSSQFGDEYAAADVLLSRGRISLTCLKYLYKPNDVLVECKGDDCMGFVSRSWPLNTKIRESPYEKYTSKGPTRTECRICEIDAWSWKIDGTFYHNPVLLTLELDFNDKAEKNIADLNIRPLEYVSDEVRDLLKRRGETFWSCRFKRFVSYKENKGRDWQASSDERYMIDLKTYHELHPEGTLEPFSRRPILGHRGERALPPECLEQDTPPGENFVFLLPLTIKGYNLRRKKWVDLRADQITEVTWNKEAFKSLVLDRKTKDIIQALISNQLDAEKSTDLISGKGNGLILLLHGGPGTGKTLTAESVAEIAEKPLYRVTCGDIGTGADEVEKYLESVLNLGKIWGCVVLLDEADVFLEQRSLEDLVRNALVSVFLRVLEYYDGILVLTSNRVGTFDEAFKSRIQLALHYPDLGPFQRLKIWENFIVRLEGLGEDMIDFDDLKDHLEELSKDKMNGRQIRNAITTARQYAQWKKAVLTYAHLKDVIEISGRFDLYLDKLNGGYTQDQLAEDEGLRLSQVP
jgi:ATPase family associated with various cellular activities (AAA)